MRLIPRSLTTGSKHAGPQQQQQQLAQAQAQAQAVPLVLDCLVALKHGSSTHVQCLAE